MQSKVESVSLRTGTLLTVWKWGTIDSSLGNYSPMQQRCHSHHLSVWGSDTQLGCCTFLLTHERQQRYHAALTSFIRFTDDALIAEWDGRLGSKAVCQIPVERQPSFGYQSTSLEDTGASILSESTGYEEFTIIGTVYFAIFVNSVLDTLYVINIHNELRCVCTYMYF